MRRYLISVLALTKPYRFRFVLGLLCGFLSGAMAFTLPLSLKLAVDTIFPGQTVDGKSTEKAKADTVGTNATATASGSVQPADEAAGTSKKKGLSSISMPGPLKHTLDNAVIWFRGQKILVIALIPGAMLLRGMLMYLNIYMLSWVGIRAANDLRKRLFAHVINLPMSFFTHSRTGDLMARSEATMAVNNTINGTFSIIIREPISIVVLIVFLVRLQPLLSLATLVVFPVCLVPVIVYGRKLRKSHSGIYTKISNLSTVMHESFTGARVIKAYNLEAHVIEQFRRAVDTVTGFFMRSVRASELPGPLIEFIGAVGVALIFAYFAFVGSDQAPGGVGDLLTFFIAVFGLYAPVKNLSRLKSQLTLARASIDPVQAMLAVKSNILEPVKAKPLQAHGAAIRFENVSFSYGEKAILHNIDLRIQPGQFVAIVGRTGSGKTSLANLLLRFYDPQTGAVLIGDTDIRTVTTRDLRANIGVVTQDTILFNDTIRHNIALGRAGATDAEIVEAAKHAFAHDFIMEKKEGYDRVVGEKGATISGGQRQRIAIARAVLKNAPILVLDEATSSLDMEAERIVQTALEELMKGRTTICIAHRLSTIQRADLIVVLDHGRIVEQGTHASLMAKGGVYHKLYSLQH